jgi:stage V sporulation protein SpoVS
MWPVQWAALMKQDSKSLQSLPAFTIVDINSYTRLKIAIYILIWLSRNWVHSVYFPIPPSLLARPNTSKSLQSLPAFTIVDINSYTRLKIAIYILIWLSRNWVHSVYFPTPPSLLPSRPPNLACTLYMKKVIPIAFWNKKVKNKKVYYSNVRGGGKLRSNFPTEREWVYNFANASMTENVSFFVRKKSYFPLFWWLKIW